MLESSRVSSWTSQACPPTRRCFCCTSRRRMPSGCWPHLPISRSDLPHLSPGGRLLGAGHAAGCVRLGAPLRGRFPAAAPLLRLLGGAAAQADAASRRPHRRRPRSPEIARDRPRLREIARGCPTNDPRLPASPPTSPLFGPDTPPANLGQSRPISGNLGQSRAISGDLAHLGALGTFLGLDGCDYAAMRREAARLRQYLPKSLLISPPSLPRREADPTRFALPGLYATAQRGITPFHRVSIS